MAHIWTKRHCIIRATTTPPQHVSLHLETHMTLCLLPDSSDDHFAIFTAVARFCARHTLCMRIPSITCIIPGWIYISCARYVGTLLFFSFETYNTQQCLFSILLTICILHPQTLGLILYVSLWRPLSRPLSVLLLAISAEMCIYFSLLILYNTWTWILHL